MQGPLSVGSEGLPLPTPTPSDPQERGVPMCEAGESVLERGWLLAPSGRPYLASILRKNQRRVFGIEVTTVYWPAKLRATGRPVIFQLEFWDCGDGALRKFEYLLPDCKEEADAILFLFSFTDRLSFEELPAQMSRVVGPDEENLIKVVIGTKFDLVTQAAVPEAAVVAFEEAQGVPVLRAGNGPGAGMGRAGVARVAPILDTLAERLWRHDQVRAGVAEDPPQA
ncbi:ciliogenesis and planar polarity effector 2 isoform X3 [Cuculus canorus]|uniref:ciliogenesis and planar polarity effector 2 isoform X3 n=1 Tax=Cuculus canorus TaxID=55661 RepID=UPI0023AB50C2|nr:ciliogenesis and planar polarity effector 2 isoform X3 [Cuculus canorus]